MYLTYCGGEAEFVNVCLQGSITHNWCGPHSSESTYGPSQHRNPFLIMPTVVSNTAFHSPSSAGMIMMKSVEEPRLEVMFTIFFASLLGWFTIFLEYIALINHNFSCVVSDSIQTDTYIAYSFFSFLHWETFRYWSDSGHRFLPSVG